VEYLPEISVVTVINMVHVTPESRLRLIVTPTASGFGEMIPDSVTGVPMVTELGETARVIVVDGRVKVVNVVAVVEVVDVPVHAVTVVVVTVVDVIVELVIVENVVVPVVVDTVVVEVEVVVVTGP